MTDNTTNDLRWHVQHSDYIQRWLVVDDSLDIAVGATYSSPSQAQRMADQLNFDESERGLL